MMFRWDSSVTVSSLLQHHITHLLLPGDRDRAGVKLVVELRVPRIQRYALHSGELLDVQHVFGVHSVRLATGVDLRH